MYKQLCFLLVCALINISCHHTTKEQKLLIAHADSLMNHHPDSAYILLKKISNYKQLQNPERALYALLMSQALDKKDILVESDSLIRYATDYFGKKEPIRAGYAWFYTARCEQNRGNAMGQAEALLKAQEYAYLGKEYKLLGHVFGDKSKMFKSQQATDSMRYYSRKALQMFSQGKDIRNSVICLIDIGLSYSIKQQIDSALFYYRQASKTALSLKDPFLISAVYSQLSYNYYKRADYQSSLKYSWLSKQTSDSFDYNKWMNFAQIYIKLEKLDSAQYYLKQYHSPKKRAAEYYHLWQTLYTKQGNYPKALMYAEKAFVAKDSDTHNSLNISFAGLEKRYNYQRIATENKTLTIHNQSKNILILLLFLILSIGAALFFIFKNRQHKKLLSQQQLLIAKEELMVKHEQEKNLILKKQFEIQQNALVAISLLKQNASKLIKDESIFKNTSQKKEFAAEQDKALASLYKNVIENIDLLYNNISKRLKNSFPDLLESDILICCLLLAGFDALAIASLMDILPKSFYMRRLQLRKKLNISHNANLNDFLVDF